MKAIPAIILCFFYSWAFAQQRFAFTRITTDDGTGLASNVVYSIHQDQKGYIWVGTANGLQRFDGSKFIPFNTTKAGSAPLPQASVSQIIAADSGKLLLVMAGIREFGIFDPSRFTYKKIPLKMSLPIPARAQFAAWKTSDGEIFMTILRSAVLHYNRKEQVFEEDHSFGFPAGWIPSLSGVYEDTIKQQIWFATDSGICIYNKQKKQLWNASNNPDNLPVLNNKKLQDRISEIYIDTKKRLWLFGWSYRGGGQSKYCLDSTGSYFLEKDTAGLLTGPLGYTEYTHFYETKKSVLWIYGNGVLFYWDKLIQRFIFNKSDMQNESISISYDYIYDIMEDKDGSLWIASDRGLYVTSGSNDSLPVVNLIFSNEKQSTSITDILELPDGDFWFASWGNGIKAVDKFLRPVQNAVYKTPLPVQWTSEEKNAVKLPWSLCRHSSTGNIWIGCNGGILLIHDPDNQTTQYLQPPQFNKSTIRYITEDKSGQVWLGTQGGRLIKYADGRFDIVQDIGTIIYKIFIDRQGIMWLATHEKGLYSLNAEGKILQHYTAEAPSGRLYGNTGYDIEQLNDSIIIYGAGVLNFINKKTGSVKLMKYEDGLPSNNVTRLRMDKTGFLWIITTNGLCRYNPGNNRITPFGRKDGIILAGQANVADYAAASGEILFGGSNAVIMFNPAVFSNNQPPPDVTITDFKIFNQNVPVDSLLQQPLVKLHHDQNSFSIYFSSLSYMQSDKLTYYYKMEGIDKSWKKADRWYYENYSLLPPGKYTFKVYCENLEGMRSPGTTEIHIFIKPPFWQTWWFLSSVLFLVALIIYDLHNARVKRVLEVEQIRNKVARDLHDDMGSTLSTINILSAMAKTKMNTDAVKTTEYLGKISDNSQRMMEAMDDIVWSIKPSNDSMQKIIARMREFAIHVLEAKEIDLNFNVDEKVYDEKLNMEARRDFFLVYKEAINNAAKYSRARRVTVEVNVQNRKLLLAIKDDGIGFDVPKADGGNGLGNIQKRTEAMRGTVKIESAQGKGAEVILRIPIA